MSDVPKNDGATSGDPNATAGQGGNGDGGGKPPAEGGTPPANFQDFLNSQPEDVKKLYEQDVQGLKGALADEREANKTLADQLRDAAKTADEKTAPKLTELATALEGAVRKAEFYEAAAGEGCNNLRLAWIAATDIEAFDRKGNVDLPVLKQRFPELFTKPNVPPPPKVGAGQGTGTQAGVEDMDSIIRRIAGRT